MTEEIPVWVNGIIQWISGVDRKTTCRDVIEALLANEGSDKHNVKDFAIMERWRRVERPLDENSKILKIWSHWGDEKKEVRLCLKRINNDIDSGRGSPVAIGNTPSLKRRRQHRSRANGKPPWGHQETLHPKRLAELGGIRKEEYEEYQTRKFRQDECDDNEQLIYDSRHCLYGSGRRGEEPRKKSGHRSYHCAGTGILHSTLLPATEEDASKPTTSKCCSKRQSKSKVRNSENIEKLMKLILAQGATIQSQLQKLKEREEQIESLEHERHRERVEKNGRNYLLETYLGSLNEAEIPVAEEEEKGNDSGVHTEGGSDQMNPVWEKRSERLQGKSGRRPVGKAADSGEGEPCGRVELSRSRRSRSEGRTPEYKCEEREAGNLKRTLSENALNDNGDSKEGGAGEDAKEEMQDVLELRRIQSQVEMWEKVFKINKKLEREEENLVRLHIKIKRFQAENIKLAPGEEVQSEDGGGVDEDRRIVEKDLDAVREDLDHNSKEIYRNFTKLRENEEVVEKKRTILNRLMNDLEQTEQEHSRLRGMVTAVPEEGIDEDEGRTSFSESPEDDYAARLSAVAPEIVPIHLYGPPRLVHDDPVKLSSSLDETLTSKPKTIHFNQRKDEESDVKPKMMKISFEDQVQNSESGGGVPEKCREPSSATPGTIKGILKNRNCNGDGSTPRLLKANGSDRPEDGDVSMQENMSPKYHVLPEDNYATFSSNPAYRECPAYYRRDHISDVKSLYGNKFPRQGSTHGGEGMYPNARSSKTPNVHNDTDSSTSSDTSGLCSMYSSSPTAEEPYGEPAAYVLDTLV